MAVRLDIGSPPRSVVMMLDFSSDISGVWDQDLLRTSKTFCDECAPVTQELVFFGPYRINFELRSILNEYELAAALGQPPSYAPAPRSGIDGWLAMSPRSQIFLIWDSVILTSQVLELRRMSSQVPRKELITRRDRTFPNLSLRFHNRTAWWHQGWLVSVEDRTNIDPPVLSVRELSDRQWLNSHHMDNASFVLFGNETKSFLAQRFFNTVFYRSNVNKEHSMPGHIRLAPGFYLPRGDWFHTAGLMSSFSWIDLAPLSRMEASRMLASHPEANISADKFHILGLNSVLRNYKIKLSTMDAEVAFINVNINGHVEWWKTLMVSAMVFIGVVVFLDRPIILQHYVRKHHDSVVVGDARKRLRIGYLMDGYFLFLIAQVASIAMVLTSYWTSSKLSDFRNGDREAGVVIFWVMTLMLHIFAGMATFNVLIYIINYFDQRMATIEIRARLFVITQVVHTHAIGAAIWFVLIDRTSSDITNLASSLMSIASLFISTVITGILADWIMYRGEGGRGTHMWPQLPTTLNGMINASEPVSFYYAVVVLMLSIIWVLWLGYFSSVLQLYEMLQISMIKISDITLLCFSLVIVLYVSSFGVVSAHFFSQSNHLPTHSPDNEKDK